MHNPVLVTKDEIIVKMPKPSKEKAIEAYKKAKYNIGKGLYSLGKKLMIAPEAKVITPPSDE